MGFTPWNRNIHFHDLVLRAVPPDCGRALDVGCGQGLLTRRLAPRCKEVIAIDADHDALNGAIAAGGSEGRVTYVQGDVMTHALPVASFDLICAVATLHHLPLRPALTRFKDLLKPGGVLVVIGLYRVHTFQDYALGVISIPLSWALTVRHLGLAKVGAPIKDPEETLQEIRSACEEVLPDAAIQQHLMFRYSLISRKS